VAEEVVLAADLLVEDLAAEAAVRWWIWRRSFSEVARVEVGNRLCKHSIIKKLQIAAFFTLSIIL
jgi:hypothetical protein